MEFLHNFKRAAANAFSHEKMQAATRKAENAFDPSGAVGLTRRVAGKAIAKGASAGARALMRSELARTQAGMYKRMIQSGSKLAQNQLRRGMADIQGQIKKYK